MSFLNQQVSRLWTFLLRPFMLWIVSKASPENPRESIGDIDGNIVYILPKRSYLDRLVLKRICKKHNLPSPDYQMDIHKKKSAGLIFVNNVVHSAVKNH